jgi:hypothetical protein
MTEKKDANLQAGWAESGSRLEGNLVPNNKQTMLHPQMIVHRNAQISQKSKSDLKLLGARTVTWTSCHTQDPVLLGAAVRRRPGAPNLCTPVLWRWFNLISVRKFLIKLETAIRLSHYCTYIRCRHTRKTPQAGFFGFVRTLLMWPWCLLGFNSVYLKAATWCCSK